MINKNFTIKLDIKNDVKNIIPTFSLSDNKTSDISIKLVSDNKTLNIENTIPFLLVVSPNKNYCADFLDIIPSDYGLLNCNLPQIMKNEVGEWQAKLMLVQGDKRITTQTFSYHINYDDFISFNNVVESDDRYPVLTELISRLSTIELHEQERETTFNTLLENIKVDINNFKLKTVKDIKDTIDNYLINYSDTITSLKNDFNEAVSNVTNGNESVTNTEIVLARKGEKSLKDKMDKIDEQFNAIEQQKANESDVKNKYYDVEQPLLTKNILTDMDFKRKHARNLFKNLQYNISTMDFYRDFLNDSNGNMYPQLESNGTLLMESVNNCKYTVVNNNESVGSQTRRLIGGFSMFSTYDIEIENIVKSSSLGVRCGIDIQNAKDNDRYCIFVAFTNNNKLEVRSEMFLNGISQGIVVNYTEDGYTENFGRFLFTIRGDKVDVYKVVNNLKIFISTVNISKNINTIELTSRTRIGLFTRLNPKESVTYTKVLNYYDSGISQGDMKPIRYKNGSTLIKNGRIYFTMSSRFESGAYQTIISQNLSGCDYKLEGVIYYIIDGTIGQDLASSILYDNDSGKFLIWNTCFNKDYHILSYGEAYCDIMHGVNYVKMTLMDKYSTNDTDFLGKYGDEDPDFFYNYKTNKWNLIICRIVYDTTTLSNNYRYFLFESDNPFTGYVFKDKTLTGTNTGGSIVKVGSEYYLVCGSNYHTTSQYNIYSLNDLSKFKPLLKDFPDGGFRGWGSIFSIPCGNFTKYGWITFDRQQNGESAWSYGNIYYYESNLLNEGCEYNVKYSY